VDCEKISKNKKIKKKFCNIVETNKERLHNLGIGFWIFILIIFVVGLLFTINIETTIRFLISDYGLLAIFVISFISDFLVQPIGPDVPLMLGIFANISNKWIILIIVLLGSYLALICSYIIGKKIGFSGIEKIIGKKKSEKIKNSPHYGIFILFLGALTPIPYIPYLAGMWNLNLKQVIFFIAIPRSIRFLIVMLFSSVLSITFLNWII
jgi:membrane protein YqaA with SNARE-associated domain